MAEAEPQEGTSPARERVFWATEASPHSSGSCSSLHLPTAIPGGAEQPEGEGGISQLLQQLWKRRVCVCAEQ